MEPLQDQIVALAQTALGKRIENGSVSQHTKNAQSVAKSWMTECWELDRDRIQTEVAIHPGLNQRIDVLDSKEMIAYEFKVSGKNATAEFYKDIVKAILWNEERENKIKKLVFITEETEGRRFLDAAMPKAFMKYVSRNGLAVDVAYVNFG